MISRSFSIKQIELKEDQIKSELINILPTEFIKKEKVIPFELKDGTLKVAIADPLKLSHGTKLKSYTKNVLFSVGTLSNIDQISNSKVWEIQVAKKIQKHLQKQLAAAKDQ